MEKALEGMSSNPPDVFNHNLKRYRVYTNSAVRGQITNGRSIFLRITRSALHRCQTKSGLMLGLGETIDEVHQVMQDLRDHQVDMLTLGQYLQPSRSHLPVARFVHPDEFDDLARIGDKLGFSHVASGPMVRSSYHADRQAAGVIAK